MSNKDRPETANENAVIGKVAAVVTAVYKGKQPFAVSFPLPESIRNGLTEKMSITFALAAWEGKDPPRPGQQVELTEITKFARGWRARAARPVELV